MFVKTMTSPGRPFLSMTPLSLKSKMTLATCLLVCGLLTGLAVPTLGYFRAQLAETIARHQYALLTGFAAELDTQLSFGRALISETAASTPPSVLASPQQARLYLEERLGVGTRKFFDHGVFLFTPEGDLLAETPFLQGRQGRNYAFRDYFRRTMESGQTEISTPYHSSKPHGHPVVMFTTPVRSTAGEIIGILGGGLDLQGENFLGKLADLRIGETGYLYLYGSDRTMIIHPDPDRILKQDVPPGANRLFDRAIEGWEGTGETVNSRGLEALASFRHLRATDWILAANSPTEEAFAPVYRAELFALTLLPALALAFMLAIWWLMARLTRPLLHLTGHVQKLHDHGPTLPHLPVTTSDEIGTLTRVFNALSEQIGRQQGALSEAKEFADDLLQQVAVPIFVLDAQSRVIAWNRACAELTGVGADAMLGSDGYRRPFYGKAGHLCLADFLLGKGQEETGHSFASVTPSRLHPEGLEAEAWFPDLNGQDRYLFLTAAPVFNRKGKLMAVVETLQDLTTSRQASEQLQTTQKFEAIGQLAGGIAHDFNNLLTVINGYGILLQRELGEESPRQMEVEAILDAGERGTSLIRQLLAFSRRQVLEPRTLDLNGQITDFKTILPRLIGEDILLDFHLSEGVGHVRVDPGQLQQVLINLAVNARDAMPGGGELTLRTARVEVGAGNPPCPDDIGPGPYVLLEFRDRGAGMEEAVRRRAFEPFFTTKAPGLGTGLGLSTVYGIIRQSGGHIEVESAPGKGSSFRIYLPRVDAPPACEQIPPALKPSGGETVLVVEDEPDVLDLVLRTLQGHGYRTIGTTDPFKALEMAAETSGGIDLLVTDMVMPGMGGPQLAEQLASQRASIPTLFITGYFSESGPPPGRGQSLLLKPFTPDRLIAKVQEILTGSLSTLPTGGDS